MLERRANAMEHSAVGETTIGSCFGAVLFNHFIRCTGSVSVIRYAALAVSRRMDDGPMPP